MSVIKNQRRYNNLTNNVPQHSFQIVLHQFPPITDFVQSQVLVLDSYFRISCSKYYFYFTCKSPLVFLTFSLDVSDSLGNGKMVLGDMISVLDILHPVNSRISAWYSPQFYLYNQFQLLIVLPKIKALLEGGQRLYSKNATSQGRVLIQRWTRCRTR